MFRTTRDAFTFLGSLGIAVMGAVCCPLVILGGYHVWLWPGLTFVGLASLFHWWFDKDR